MSEFLLAITIICFIFIKKNIENKIDKEITKLKIANMEYYAELEKHLKELRSKINH